MFDRNIFMQIWNVERLKLSKRQRLYITVFQFARFNFENHAKNWNIIRFDSQLYLFLWENFFVSLMSPFSLMENLLRANKNSFFRVSNVRIAFRCFARQPRTPIATVKLKILAISIKIYIFYVNLFENKSFPSS